MLIIDVNDDRERLPAASFWVCTSGSLFGGTTMMEGGPDPVDIMGDLFSLSKQQNLASPLGDDGDTFIAK